MSHVVEMWSSCVCMTSLLLLLCLGEGSVQGDRYWFNGLVVVLRGCIASAAVAASVCSVMVYVIA